MERLIGPALVLAAVFIASSAYAKTEVKARHHYRHHTGVRPAQAVEHHAPAAAQRAPAAAAPYFAPPLPGGSDTGGY